MSITCHGETSWSVSGVAIARILHIQSNSLPVPYVLTTPYPKRRLYFNFTRQEQYFATQRGSKLEQYQPINSCHLIGTPRANQGTRVTLVYKAMFTLCQPRTALITQKLSRPCTLNQVQGFLFQTALFRKISPSSWGGDRGQEVLTSITPRTNPADVKTNFGCSKLSHSEDKSFNMFPITEVDGLSFNQNVAAEKYRSIHDSFA